MKAALALGSLAALAAGQAFTQSEQQRAQMQTQAKSAQAQAQAAANSAIAMQQQADAELRKGEVEKRRIDTDRDRMSRAYQSQAGARRSLLASGNLDIASGSAADSLLGDAMLFGEDMAANRHTWSLAEWQAKENARQAQWQADQLAAQSRAYGSQASWLSRSAGGLGNSLLSGLFAGGSSLARAYLL